ncbi:hypothetical protein [Pseudarthrobacter sp. R1]|nr:hypothetical protein [Pseudarthrobacter sp. R1]
MTTGGGNIILRNLPAAGSRTRFLLLGTREPALIITAMGMDYGIG